MPTFSILDIRSSMCPRCGGHDALVIVKTVHEVLNRCCLCGEETTEIPGPAPPTNLS